MKSTTLPFVLLLLFFAFPCFADDEGEITEKSMDELTTEDQEIVKMLELLEMLELLDNIEDVAALEDDQ